MAIIQSDNPRIEGLLKTLESLVEEGGGGLHSDLVIESFDGNLAVRTKEPMAKGKEIIRLTRKVLLPEDHYEVGVKGDEFTLNFPENGIITDLQKRLIECMVDIYNATDKVCLHRDYSFLLSLRDQPDILSILQDGRLFTNKLGEWIDQLGDLDDEDMMNKFIAKTFLKTRHLGYNDHVRVTNVSILMPVVDFLNHNWSGSNFSVSDGGVRRGDLTVGCAQPMENSTECYAFYGAMDSFDTLVRYDFVDDFAPFVRSVPIELDVPGGGKICINSNPGAMSRKKLSKGIADLKLYVPVTKFDEEDAVLKASHILIPTQGSLRALRRVLLVLLLHFQDKANMDEAFKTKWVTEAEQKIVSANIEYYEALKTDVQSALALSPEHFGLKNIQYLAELQLEKLNQYQCLDV